MIKVKDVALPKRLMIESLDFQNPGVIAVLGPNGAGKTTFLKLLAGLLPDSTGSVMIRDKELKSLSSTQLAQQVTYLPPNEVHAFAFRARDVILLGDIKQDGSGDRRANELMEQLSIAHLGNRLFSELSSGEQRRVALARSLLADAPILLLDEPLAQIDVAGALVIEAVLRTLRDKLIFITTHDPNFRFANEAVLINGGRVVNHGPADKIITQANLSSLFGAKVSLKSQFAFESK
jgi:iron complex transport system ATP-binding protein